jgi:hypothetical protein
VPALVPAPALVLVLVLYRFSAHRKGIRVDNKSGR